MQRRKLSDILSADDRKAYFANWNDVKPAADYGAVVPPGEYEAHVIDGSCREARTGTPDRKSVV